LAQRFSPTKDKQYHVERQLPVDQSNVLAKPLHIVNCYGSSFEACVLAYLLTKDPASIFEINDIGALVKELATARIVQSYDRITNYLNAAASKFECICSEDFGTRREKNKLFDSISMLDRSKP
jgi:hypothetical protein